MYSGVDQCVQKPVYSGVDQRVQKPVYSGVDQRVQKLVPTYLVDFRELWEQKPLLVRRHRPDYNQGWFSTTEMDRILRQVAPPVSQSC